MHTITPRNTLDRLPYICRPIDSTRLIRHSSTVAFPTLSTLSGPVKSRVVHPSSQPFRRHHYSLKLCIFIIAPQQVSRPDANRTTRHDIAFASVKYDASSRRCFLVSLADRSSHSRMSAVSPRGGQPPYNCARRCQYIDISLIVLPGCTKTLSHHEYTAYGQIVNA